MSDIHLEVYGQGKPIVWVHGWAMHSGIWRTFAQQLADKYQVICIDLPGHGHSEAIDPFTLQRISDALIEKIETAVCWLGWSLGASVVLDIAARYPERVSSLILVAGNPSFLRDDNEWPGLKARLLDDFAEQLHNNCQVTLLRFLSLQINNLSDQKRLLQTLKTAVLECPTPDEKTLQGGLEILKNADLRPALSKLNVPVSVILGGLDTLVPVAVGEKMQQLLPSLQLNIIDRAGHVPFLSHSDETAAMISRFMDETCI